MIDLLIGIILALIMLGIGLSLKPVDFRHLLWRPKVLLLGLFLQLVVLPVWAFAVCNIIGLPADFAAGVMILSACPGGLTSNFISYILRANTTLAVSLTICNTTLSLITIPFVVNLSLDYFWTGEDIYHLPIIPTAGRIFIIVLVPIMVGMLYRRHYEKIAAYLQPRLRWVSIFLLGLLFALKLFAPTTAGGSNLTFEEIGIILPASLLVNIGALLAGYVLGRLFRFGRNDQLTLGVEAGIQNTSLAFLISSTLLNNEQMLKPALVYAMFTFLTAFLYGLWLKPGMWKALKKEWRLLHFFSSPTRQK